MISVNYFFWQYFGLRLSLCCQHFKPDSELPIWRLARAGRPTNSYRLAVSHVTRFIATFFFSASSATKAFAGKLAC